MATRLLLISHACTAAQRVGRLPADDPLNARGLAEAEAEAHTLRMHPLIEANASAFVSPSLCARATATALGVAASADARLADMNYGNWRGRRLADIAQETPQELAAWTRDPDAAPHGGESFSQLVKRTGKWMDALNGATDAEASATRALTHTVIAVTHASLLRAAIVHALGASPDVFSRIEIAPLSMIGLRRSSRGWTWWPASR